MAAQEFSIDFGGYWREPNKSGVPNKSGIYCVYTCSYNASDNSVALKKLVYIGESADVGSRISNHEHQSDWEKHLNKGEQLCYTFGEIGSTYRERCEAAMIFKHNPPVNDKTTSSFPYDQTTLKLSGKTAFLVCNFTVNRT